MHVSVCILNKLDSYIYAIFYPAHFHVTDSKILKMLFYGTFYFILRVYPSLLAHYGATTLLLLFCSVSVAMMRIRATPCLSDRFIRMDK